MPDHDWQQTDAERESLMIELRAMLDDLKLTDAELLEFGLVRKLGVSFQVPRAGAWRLEVEASTPTSAGMQFRSALQYLGETLPNGLDYGDCASCGAAMVLDTAGRRAPRCPSCGWKSA